MIAVDKRFGEFPFSATRLHLSPLVVSLPTAAAQIVWLAAAFYVGGLFAAGPASDSDILPFGSNWKYLQPVGLNQDPFNNLEGVEFDFEWFLPDFDEDDLTVIDDGPVTLSWQGPAPSPIGYGEVEGFANGFATEIDVPAEGDLFATYLRSEPFFRPPGVSQDGPFAIEFLAVDGMVMYLDGEEIDLNPDDPNHPRYNCCLSLRDGPFPHFPVSYLDRSLTVGNRNDFVTRRLTGLQLSVGPHVLAVSLHKHSPASRDIGFDMRLLVVPCLDPPPGDYNGDCLLNTTDVDSLTTQIAAGPPHDLAFDLSGDGTVDVGDLIQWRTAAAAHNGLVDAYPLGDSNLDGFVDATDLRNLALNWRQSVAEWSGGDFTADGIVNTADLNALALNWRQSIATAPATTAPVPEPSAHVLALSFAGLALFWRRLGQSSPLQKHTAYGIYDSDQSRSPTYQYEWSDNIQCQPSAIKVRWHTSPQARSLRMHGAERGPCPAVFL